MAETIKSLIEMVDERPNMDMTAAFETLWGIFSGLRQKVNARFELYPDASTADLQPYKGLPESGAEGFLSAFSGDELDWFVHSWIGNPKLSFCNMHLTAWVGAHINAPHLGMALATTPDIFFYMDLLPRVDVLVDVDYLDRYYQPLNDFYLSVRQNPNLNLFVSKSLYVRQSLSETALCFTCKDTSENLALVTELASKLYETWQANVDSAEPLPVEQRPVLAERDLTIRRQIAERDPANVIGERLFGVDLTARLVRALWGGDRINPRVGL
jgi:hypothetical protein